MVDHCGRFVAGRYRDGLVSDNWTDVRRCANRTFVTYLASCRCGWTGPDRTPTPFGYDQCLRDAQKHQAYDDTTTAAPSPPLLLQPRPDQARHDLAS